MYAAFASLEWKLIGDRRMAVGLSLLSPSTPFRRDSCRSLPPHTVAHLLTVIIRITDITKMASHLINPAKTVFFCCDIQAKFRESTGLFVVIGPRVELALPRQTDELTCSLLARWHRERHLWLEQRHPYGRQDDPVRKGQLALARLIDGRQSSSSELTFSALHLPAEPVLRLSTSLFLSPNKTQTVRNPLSHPSYVARFDLSFLPPTPTSALGPTDPALTPSLSALPAHLNLGVHSKTKFSMALPSTLPLLAERQIEHVVLFGIETHICVLQTALELLSGEGLGGRKVQVHVLADGVSSCNKEEIPIALAVSDHAHLEPRVRVADTVGDVRCLALGSSRRGRHDFGVASLPASA